MADVPQIIDSANSNAQGWIPQAEGFINKVAELAGQEFPVDVPGQLAISFTQITQDAVGQLTGGKPIRPGLQTVPTNVPAAPSVAVAEVGDIEVPGFDRDAPVLAIPAAPAVNLPGLPPTPEFTLPAIPDAPVVTLPDAPEFAALAFPDPPSVTLPAFDAVAPTDELLAPTNNFSFYEIAYNSAVLDAVKAKILSDLENGGYGIETADESRLWDRAREREDAAATAAVDEIRRAYTQTGFPIPPGAMQTAIARAEQDRQNKISSLSRDIALKRSELYQQNRQFVISTGVTLEQALMGYHGAMMERALNYSRAAAEIGISYYDLKVKRFNALMAAYQTEAQVFEAKIRAALTTVEVYKTQIQAKGLEAEAQRNLVEVYRAKLAGVQTVVDIYKARMEAANVHAAIERTRMDAFRAQIEAFVATIQGENARVNLYEAQIRGETAKIQGFEAEVRAHAAKAEVAKTRADIELGKLRGSVESGRLKIDAYNAQIAGFRAQVEAASDSNRATAEMYRADASIMESIARATSDAFRVQLEELRMGIGTVLETMKANIESARAKLDVLKSQALVRMEASKTGVNFYASAVSGALSSINALAAQVESKDV